MDNDQTRPVRGWGSAPRISAADALVVLARHASCCTPAVQAAIRELSKDPVVAVRLQISTRVLCLYSTARDLMWELVREWAAHEQNPSVLAHAVQALRQLPLEFAGETVPLVVSIFERTPKEPDTKDTCEACIHFFGGLALGADDATCKAKLDEIVNRPLSQAPDGQQLITCLAKYLPVKDRRVADAAFAVLLRILEPVIPMMQVLETTNAGVSAWPRDAQEQYRILLHLADSVAERLYFASGAFQDATAERVALPANWFYQHARPLLKLLTTIGHPHSAHNVIETLKHFVHTDPPGVLLMVGDVVRAGSKWGYQYEDLAEGLIVDLVEQYLAECRPLLRERPECHQALMDILDVFVRVGWSRAHQLTYRLSEIYR